ncbi:MAG: KamA family radical SAM protein, partial [Polyangiaceae bacterium]|nr:KamA family radical SAM protein [Polyangiaceae bacterium]
DEAVRVPGDLHDPLGEVGHEVVPGLVRRYPDRALLIVSAACAVHCRFCTRSRVTRIRRGATRWSQLDPALQWLREHPDVRELLLSGGDPLIASTQRIHELLTRVRAVPSIEVIRIGTRVPAVLPMRIEPELIDVLRAHGPIWIMTHFNHPRELTAQACQALSLLADGGLPVMNQTVLLRGVNDNAEVLSELCRGLVRQRVRPYYLLHADVVEGTAHLRTRLDDSIGIFSKLQGTLSGIALPKLMVDTPGGHGKVPVGPETIVGRAPGRTTLVTYRGEHVDVIDP